jgi:hypothetical protein
MTRRSVRDEEAAGSIPATPTEKAAGHSVFVTCGFVFQPFRCPILGAKWEGATTVAGRILVNIRSSIGTADPDASSAR